MKGRHALIPYTLEEVPRPGSREICIRRPPDGARVRSREAAGYESDEKK